MTIDLEPAPVTLEEAEVINRINTVLRWAWYCIVFRFDGEFDLGKKETWNALLHLWLYGLIGIPMGCLILLCAPSGMWEYAGAKRVN